MMEIVGPLSMVDGVGWMVSGMTAIIRNHPQATSDGEQANPASCREPHNAANTTVLISGCGDRSSPYGCGRRDTTGTSAECN